jgi:1,4-dihydroxy-2-naphthoyl-CoA synthase
MTVVVTILFTVDVERAREVELEQADAHQTVIEAARRHGMRSHRRLYGDGEMLDIDEWESSEGRDAFLAEAAPSLRLLAESRGSGPPVVKVWQSEPEAR